MKTTFRSGEWYDFIPEIVAGLRMLPTRIGISPFLMVYKQEPKWHSLPAELIIGESTEPTSDQQEALVETQVAWWDEVVHEIKQRLDKRDSAMVSEYMSRTCGLDPRCAFKPGDLVLLKQTRKGKLFTKCTGPYKFIAYVEPRKVVADI